ncbi:MAG: extracellular solute-binding protein [Candidatus Paceibacterota bacterium]
MTDLSPFKVAVLIGFGLMLFGGFIALTLFSGAGGGETVTINLWGTAPQSIVREAIKQSVPDDTTVRVEYIEKEADTFDTELLEALAAGEGPDLFFLPQDKILKHQGKLWTIPFESYEERRFQDTFASVTEVYLTSQGSIGLPIIVDPMVMYWNRTLFDQHRISAPPQTWDSFNNEPLRSFIDRDGQQIDQAMIAFGNFSNITNAKDILTTLVMQSGSPLVERQGLDTYRAVMGISQEGQVISSAVAAVNFYTQFADPNKVVYTWNNSLPDSKQMFLNGDLAVYVGFASERNDLMRENPNLDFGVAMLPQSSGRDQQLTGARLEALAIPSQSQKKGVALTAAALLTEGEGARIIAEWSGLPPARRDLLSETQSRSHMDVFHDSAFISRSWFDPEPESSTEVFREMIQSIQSGRLQPAEAIGRANRELQNLLDQ